LFTQQRCSRVVGQTSPAASYKPSALGDRQFQPHIEPAPFRIEQQLCIGTTLGRVSQTKVQQDAY
jgi:hypothetical protein